MKNFCRYSVAVALILVAVCASASLAFDIDSYLKSGNETPSEPVHLGIMRFTSQTYDVPDAMAARISDFFGRMLFNADGIQLVERQRLEDAGRELNLGMSGLVDDKSAAQIGKIAGCQYLLLGSITNLAKGASATAIPGISLFGGAVSAKQKVKADLDVRVIKAETAEVVFAGTAQGESSKFDTAFSIMGITQIDKEYSGIENSAIVAATAELAPKIQKALTGKDTLSEKLKAETKKGTKSKSKTKKTAK